MPKDVYYPLNIAQLKRQVNYIISQILNVIIPNLLPSGATVTGEYVTWNQSLHKWVLNGLTTITLGAITGTNQGSSAIAIGNNASIQNSGPFSICIGANSGGGSGGVFQGDHSVILGSSDNDSTGFKCGSRAIMVGSSVGTMGCDSDAICIGNNISLNQRIRQSAICIGDQIAANNGLPGPYSIAIGSQAGYTLLGANAIILNATGNPLNVTDSDSGSGYYVAPISSQTKYPTATLSNLQYNTTTKEIVYNSQNSYGQYYYQNIAISASSVAVNTTTPALVANLSIPIGNKKWFMQAAIASNYTSSTMGAFAKCTLCLLNSGTVIEGATFKQSTNSYINDSVGMTSSYNITFNDWFDLSAVSATAIDLGLFIQNRDNATSNFVISIQMFSYN